MNNTNHFGSYILIIKVNKDIRIKVGRLGEFLFPKGFHQLFSNDIKITTALDYDLNEFT